MKDLYARSCLLGATIFICMAVAALLFGNSSSWLFFIVGNMWAMVGVIIGIKEDK